MKLWVLMTSMAIIGALRQYSLCRRLAFHYQRANSGVEYVSCLDLNSVDAVISNLANRRLSKWQLCSALTCEMTDYKKTAGYSKVPAVRIEHEASAPADMSKFSESPAFLFSLQVFERNSPLFFSISVLHVS